MSNQNKSDNIEDVTNPNISYEDGEKITDEILDNNDHDSEQVDTNIDIIENEQLDDGVEEEIKTEEHIKAG
jgi:hypothetical protein